MKKYILLYKTLRKCDRQTPSDASEYADKNIPISLIVELVLVLCAAAGCGYIGYTFAGMFELFGGVSVVLAVLALLGGCIVTVKGLIRLINSLYMSTDTALLITMPVSPIMLATVRLANVLSGSLLIMAGILLSFAVGYGFAVSTGFSFWLGVFLYIVLIPLFATLATAALAILCMSVFRFIRSRNVMKYIGVLGALIGGIAYVCWYALSSADVDLAKAAGTVLNFTKDYVWLIPVIPFIRRFTEMGKLLPILQALLVTAAALAAYLAAAGFLYLKSAVNMQDAASSRRLTDRSRRKIYKARSPQASYRQKELRLLLRNPVYLLKDFILAFGWPLIIIPLFLVSRMTAGPTPESSKEELAALKATLTSDVTLILVLTLSIVCAAILFLNMFNDLAYSSITREGDMFSVMKQLPLSLRDQIRAKRDVARSIVGISTVVYLTIAALVGIISGLIPWYVLPYGLSVGLPLLQLVVDIDIISGIRHANLHWDNEAAAIKKNTKLILGSYLLAVLIIIGLVFLYSFLSGHPFLALPCLLAVPLLLIVLAVLTDRRIYTVAEEKLRKL